VIWAGSFLLAVLGIAVVTAVAVVLSKSDESAGPVMVSSPPSTTNPLPTLPPTTNTPADKPTKAPVMLQPTDNPTRSPVTQQPSDLSSIQPAPTKPPAPTNRPSQSLSLVSTLMPTMPSQLPSSAITLQPQTQLVDVVMRLENTYGRLSGGTEFDFQAASELHLREEIENSVHPPGLVKLVDIQCQIYGQTVVEPRPTDDTNNSDSNRNLQHWVNDPQLRRYLQSQQPLRVGFNAFIKFQSEAEDNIVSDWVRECFNSVSKRQAYMDRLRQANAGAFNILTDVQVLVEGEKPEEEVPPPPIIGPDDGGSGGGSRGGVSIWIFLPGGFLVVIFVSILIYKKHKSSTTPRRATV